MRVCRAVAVAVVLMVLVMVWRGWWLIWCARRDVVDDEDKEKEKARGDDEDGEVAGLEMKCV